MKTKNERRSHGHKKEKEIEAEAETARTASDGIAFSLRARFPEEYSSEFASPRTEMKRRKQER